MIGERKAKSSGIRTITIRNPVVAEFRFNILENLTPSESHRSKIPKTAPETLTNQTLENPEFGRNHFLHGKPPRVFMAINATMHGENWIPLRFHLGDSKACSSESPCLDTHPRPTAVHCSFRLRSHDLIVVVVNRPPTKGRIICGIIIPKPSTKARRRSRNAHQRQKARTATGGGAR